MEKKEYKMCTTAEKAMTRSRKIAEARIARGIVLRLHRTLVELPYKVQGGHPT